MDLVKTNMVSKADKIGTFSQTGPILQGKTSTRTVQASNGEEVGKPALVNKLKSLQVNPPNQQDGLPAPKRRYNPQSGGCPPEKMLRYSGSDRYCELISDRSKVPDSIKLIIMYFGEENLELLMRQNPGLQKLVSLDGLKKMPGGVSETIEGIDFRGCSMKGAEFEYTVFKRCKFTKEQLNSADLERIVFQDCSFEGDHLASSVLENAKFFPENPQETSHIVDSSEQADSRQRTSQIIFQSCVNLQGEFNLKQWLDVMDKNNYLCPHNEPLDELTKKILIENIERIKSDYPQKIKSIIFYLFSISLDHDASALSFVENNPEFFDRKVNDLSSVYFDFKTTILSNSNRYDGNIFTFLEDLNALLTDLVEPLSDGEEEDLFDLDDSVEPVEDVHSLLPREDMLVLMINIIELLMFPHPKHEYIELGVNTNGINNGTSENSAKNIENKTNLYFGSDYKLHRSIECARAKIFQWGLEAYRTKCHRVWESCPREGKLTIARYCLRHKIVAVDHGTTIEFMKLLFTNRELEPWLDNFAANMDEHKNNERRINVWIRKFDADTEEYSSEEIDESLKDFEQWLKNVASDLTLLPAAVTAMEH